VLGTIARRIIALLIRRELLTTTGEWLEVPDLTKLSELRSSMASSYLKSSGELTRVSKKQTFLAL
jgi:hypothetical protein